MLRPFSFRRPGNICDSVPIDFHLSKANHPSVLLDPQWRSILDRVIGFAR